jgi:hypothetical protein
VGCFFVQSHGGNHDGDIDANSLERALRAIPIRRRMRERVVHRPANWCTRFVPQIDGGTWQEPGIHAGFRPVIRFCIVRRCLTNSGIASLSMRIVALPLFSRTVRPA